MGEGLGRPSLSHSCGKSKNPFRLCSPCVPRLYRTSTGARPPLAWRNFPSTQCRINFHHQMSPEFSAASFGFFVVAEIHFSFSCRPAFLSLRCFFFMGVSVRTAVSLLFLPFVVCFLGPAFGYGWMDTGEKVVSIAEDDGSDSGLHHTWCDRG